MVVSAKNSDFLGQKRVSNHFANQLIARLDEWEKGSWMQGVGGLKCIVCKNSLSRRKYILLSTALIDKQDMHHISPTCTVLLTQNRITVKHTCCTIWLPSFLLVSTVILCKYTFGTLLKTKGNANGLQNKLFP